jgi:hypothetical protein
VNLVCFHIFTLAELLHGLVTDAKGTNIETYFYKGADGKPGWNSGKRKIGVLADTLEFRNQKTFFLEESNKF